jgi:hypothetical protein
MPPNGSTAARSSGVMLLVPLLFRQATVALWASVGSRISPSNPGISLK